MARKRREEEEEAADETEAVEAVEEAAEESAPAGAEFVPDRGHKPTSDVYTALLSLIFVAFLTGSIVAGRELWEHYDVQFWGMFSKNQGKEAPAPAPVPDATTDPAVTDPNAAPPTPPPGNP